jgi:hypothetical protein
VDKAVQKENHVNIAIRRDAVHYLCMLLEDQLFDLAGHAVSQHLETIRQAYRHIKAEIEHSLDENSAVV